MRANACCRCCAPSQITLQAIAAQLARRALPAAVGRHAVVAGQRFFPDEFKGSQLIRQLPYLFLVQPHERRLDDEILLHRQIERHVQRLDEDVPAIRISAEVRLAHSGDKRGRSDPFGQDGGKRQEHQVASRHERIRESSRFGSVRYREVLPRQRARSKLSEQAHVQHMVADAEFCRDGCGALELQRMALSVPEGDGLHFLIALQCPEQAGRAVLASAENDDRLAFSFFQSLHLLQLPLSMMAEERAAINSISLDPELYGSAASNKRRAAARQRKRRKACPS
ncbi:hypothetical protein BN871_DW_00290 [Paenibacillus sp. P22]|nr:hypothetical protein BN871_DW_00290 [Paenibacillus sp. P22]